jgi:prepilin peptidase dependent protein B
MLRPRLQPVSSGRRRQRGLSLIELMIGTTIGLFVVAGTVSLYATNASSSRRLLAEARLNQDLRAAMDLVSRDLRRSGYWGNAIKGTTITGSGASTTANPYRGVSSTDDEVSGKVTYQFSREAEDDALTDNEEFGFQLEGGVLKMQTEKDGWADMTDINQVTVTNFSVTTEPTDIALGSLCTVVCAVGTPNCPTMTVRRFVIRLSGQSVTDTSVVRTLEASVRPRNDQLEGQCPA